MREPERGMAQGPHQGGVAGERDGGDVAGGTGCRRGDAGGCQQAAGSCVRRCWHRAAPRGGQAAGALAAAAVARIVKVNSVLHRQSVEYRRPP